MRHIPIVSVALALALMGTLLGPLSRPVQAAPTRPDIVVFYIDDWAPYPARMWDETERTPELAMFARQGVEFRNAIASTPVCGPARVNLLTGKYGHRTGTTQNKLGSYTGRNTVATKLRSQGYRTAWVGKHINGLWLRHPTRSSMSGLADRWDQFDVIWPNLGRFYDWRQYRKGGTYQYGRKATDHSSYQAAKRAVQAVRKTPGNEPLFLMVSLYDGHKPYDPMPRFKRHPMCADMSPWAGPAYNEQDVSDKPAYVRNHPLLPREDFSLRNRCEHAMTIDWVVGRVNKALERAGRLDGTLEVLVADNGYLYGDHRLTGKHVPYSAHVPMYVRWPAAIGNSKRVVTEPVSNVDLGKTFCAAAGCTMPGSDGMNLLPLIMGSSDRLERKFIYSEFLYAHPDFGASARAFPAWVGIQSTLAYDDHLWSFTRYQTGEEELYDITLDPHKLENLAGKPAYSAVQSDLRGFWRAIRNRDGVRFLGKLRR